MESLKVNMKTIKEALAKGAVVTILSSFVVHRWYTSDLLIKSLDLLLIVVLSGFVFQFIYRFVSLLSSFEVSPETVLFEILFMIEFQYIVALLRNSYLGLFLIVICMGLIMIVYEISIRHASKLSYTLDDFDINWCKSIYRLTLSSMISLGCIFLTVNLTTQSSYNVTDFGDIPLPEHHSREELIDYASSTITRLALINYPNLSIENRIEFAQWVEFIEAKLEGRPAMTVLRCELSDGVAGSFSPSRHAICIDDELISSNDPLELLLTVLHEGRHATQYYWIRAIDWNGSNVSELAILKDLVVIRYEFMFYINGNSEQNALYKEQSIEIDAEFFAFQIADIYIESVLRLGNPDYR